MQRLLSVTGAVFALTFAVSASGDGSSRRLAHLPAGLDQNAARAHTETGRSSVSRPVLRHGSDGYYVGLHTQVVMFPDCIKLVASLSELMIKPLDEAKFYRDYLIGCVPYDDERSYVVYQVVAEALIPQHAAELRDIVTRLSGQEVFGVTIGFRHAVASEEEGSVQVAVEKGGRDVEIYRSASVFRSYPSYLPLYQVLLRENSTFRGPAWAPVLSRVTDLIGEQALPEFREAVTQGDLVKSSHLPIFVLDSGEKIRGEVVDTNFRDCRKSTTPCL